MSLKSFRFTCMEEICFFVMSLYKRLLESNNQCSCTADGFKFDVANVYTLSQGTNQSEVIPFHVYGINLLLLNVCI